MWKTQRRRSEAADACLGHDSAGLGLTTTTTTTTIDIVAEAAAPDDTSLAFFLPEAQKLGCDVEMV
jgi:hypothetical protein